jgi:hypothetical protein
MTEACEKAAVLRVGIVYTFGKTRLRLALLPEDFHRRFNIDFKWLAPTDGSELMESHISAPLLLTLT